MNRNPFTLGFILILFAAATGCARQGYIVHDPAYFGGLPVRMEITGTPFYPQKAHQCGPAALAMALNWSGSQVTPEQIKEEIYTPAREGSLQPLLVSDVRNHNRLPFIIRDFESLLRETAAGHPVIVLQNLGLRWYPRWHYAVIIGYDRDKQIMILRSGGVFRKESTWSLFRRTWNRAGEWGLVTLPLTEMPASADEESYLTAVLALENVNHPEAASVAYETALKKWPENLVALMGLGNCHYTAGNLKKAGAVFRRALELYPDCADAYNNLSLVLAGQGKYDLALNAARKAIGLGGPNKEMYRQTLEEIIKLKAGEE